jgi:HK97 family phage major capsid protein
MTTRTLERQRQLLAHYGYDPAHAGRAYNRTAAPPAVAPPKRDPDLDIVIPESPAELEDLLNDSEKMKKIFANKDKFGDLISAYAKVTLDKDQAIATQVREEVQRVTAQFFKDNGAENIKRVNLDPGGPRQSLAAQKSGIYNAKALGAPLDEEFDGSAEFARAIWHGRDRDAKLQAKLQRVRNAFTSEVPSEGGFLVPEVLRAELLRVSLETAIVRPRARVVPMETSRVPYPMIDSTTNAGSVHGGIITYWTEEGGTLQRSNAKFGRILLDAKKHTAYAVVPNELIADSAISFQQFIDTAFPEAIAFGEDGAFFDGTGVGEPSGFMDAAAMVAITAEVGQPADTIVWENLVKAFSRMLPASLNRAVWIVAPNTFPELATMALSVGTGGSAVWLNNGAAGPPMTILGRPVIISEKARTLGDAGDVNFVDLGYYLIGDRQVMSASSSDHKEFDTDSTAFRFIQRVDGRPWLQSPITPRNNSSDTLSAYVQLAARA